ncbi:hypothetical protein [Spirosoma fluminis]
MIRKFLYYSGWILIILVTQWSCRTDRETLVRPNQSILSIDEARHWFEGKNAGARTAAHAPDNRLVYWKYAKNDVLPNGTPVVVVPLLYGYEEPVFVSQNDLENRQEKSKSPKLKATKANVRIQKKLMISKDGEQYRSCVMAIFPSEDYRKKNNRVTKDNFDGTVLIYDESEQYYLLGLKYKNGRLKETLKPKNLSGGRLDQPCYRGIYQQNAPAHVGGSSTPRWVQTAEQNNIPMNIDLGDYGISGGSWQLVDVQEVDCDTYTPVQWPILNPEYGTVDWVTGGGGSSGPGPNDPNIPVPIDEGMPNDLNPVDAFTWEMQNRIGTKIYFDYDEIETIRDYPQLMTSIRNYVQLYNRKPDGGNTYQMSFEDQQRYPKFANFIRNNVRDYVMSRPKILNALKQFSGLSERKIKAILTFGQGPKIVVEQLSAPEFWGQDGYEYGSFDPQVPDVVKIDKLTLIRYEDNILWPELEAAYFTLLAQLIIHETSHYGAAMTQTIDYTDGENSTPNGGPYTHRFDMQAFGYPNNGYEVMLRKYILRRAP